MKRLIALASAGALTITLAGCSGGSSEQSTEQESIQQEVTQQESESPQSSSTAEQNNSDSQDALDYFNSGIDDKVSDAYSAYGRQLQALSDGDYSTCISIGDEVVQKCNEIIDMEAPEIAQRTQGYMVEAATCIREASLSLSLAANTDDINEFTEHVEAATEHTEEFGSYVEKANTSLFDMYRQANQDSSSEASGNS